MKISKTIGLICIANLLAYLNKTSLITQRNEAVDIYLTAAVSFYEQVGVMFAIAIIC